MTVFMRTAVRFTAQCSCKLPINTGIVYIHETLSNFRVEHGNIINIIRALCLSVCVCVCVRACVRALCIFTAYLTSHSLRLDMVNVKLFVCLTNYALRHENVWVSGCIDSRFLDIGTSWR
jgi:hypothetical protein